MVRKQQYANILFERRPRMMRERRQKTYRFRRQLTTPKEDSHFSSWEFPVSPSSIGVPDYKLADRLERKINLVRWPGVELLDHQLAST